MKVISGSDELTKPFFLIGRNVEMKGYANKFPTCAMSQRIVHHETRQANYLHCSGDSNYCGFQPGLWRSVP